LIVIVHTIPPKSTNADGDNLDTAVLDLLVDAEILASDNLKTFQTRLSHAEICESGPWGTRVRFYGVSYDAAPKTKKTAKPRPESKKPAPQPQKQTARLDLGQTKPPSGRVERIFSKKIKKLFLTRNN
jgi:hypothetical protein